MVRPGSGAGQFGGRSECVELSCECRFCFPRETSALAVSQLRLEARLRHSRRKERALCHLGDRPHEGTVAGRPRGSWR